MSRTKKLLLVCLAVSIAATLILVISAIIEPEKASPANIVCTGIVPIVLCLTVLPAKKSEEKPDKD
jgi:hypothetical protein